MSIRDSVKYPIPFIPKMSTQQTDALAIEKAKLNLLSGNTSETNINMDKENNDNDAISMTVEHQGQIRPVDMSGVVSDLMKQVGESTETLLAQRMESMEERIVKRLSESLRPKGQNTTPVVEPGHIASTSSTKAPGHNTDKSVELAAGRHNTLLQRVERQTMQQSEDTLSLFAGGPIDTRIDKEGARGRHDRPGMCRSRSTSHSGRRSRSRDPHRSPDRRRVSGTHSHGDNDSHGRYASSHRTGMSRTSSDRDENVPPIDADQAYWEAQVEDYEQETTLGPEVASMVASSMKVYWQKPIKEEKLKVVLGDAKIPSNCSFMTPKKVNKEIWSLGAPFTRSRDHSMQLLQETHATATSALIQGMSELAELQTDLAKSEKAGEEARTAVQQTVPFNLTRIMGHLQRAAKLNGKLNQEVTSHRRDAFKVHIPKSMKELADNTSPDDTMLFGDDLAEQIKLIKAKNEVLRTLSPNADKPKERPKGGTTNSG